MWHEFWSSALALSKINLKLNRVLNETSSGVRVDPWEEWVSLFDLDFCDPGRNDPGKVPKC